MLDKIKDTACPDCGCAEVKERRKFEQHISGNWNESIKFACERVMTYSPNIGHGGVKFLERPCTRSEAAQQKKKERRKLVDDLKAMMQERGLKLEDLKGALWDLEFGS